MSHRRAVVFCSSSVRPPGTSTTTRRIAVFVTLENSWQGLGSGIRIRSLAVQQGRNAIRAVKAQDGAPLVLICSPEWLHLLLKTDLAHPYSTMRLPPYTHLHGAFVGFLPAVRRGGQLAGSPDVGGLP